MKSDPRSVSSQTETSVWEWSMMNETNEVEHEKFKKKRVRQHCHSHRTSVCVPTDRNFSMGVVFDERDYRG